MKIQDYIKLNNKYSDIQKKALIELYDLFELKTSVDITENDYENRKNKIIEDYINNEKEIKQFAQFKEDIEEEYQKGSIEKKVYEESIKNYEESRNKLIKEKQKFYNEELKLLIELDSSEFELAKELVQESDGTQSFKIYKRVPIFYILSAIFVFMGMNEAPFFLLGLLFAILGLGYAIVEKLNILIEQNNRRSL